MSSTNMQGRRVQKVIDIKEPGDYTGPVVGYTGDKPAVFFLKPNARDEDVLPRARVVQHCIIDAGYHSCEEHEDGTITITPSIGATVRGGGPETSDGWHGYLRHGEWVFVSNV